MLRTEFICTAFMNYWRKRKVRSLLHSRCEKQLKRVKTGIFLHRIQHFPFNTLKISHNKHVFTEFALSFLYKRQPFFQHKRGALNLIQGCFFVCLFVLFCFVFFFLFLFFQQQQQIKNKFTHLYAVCWHFHERYEIGLNICQNCMFWDIIFL